jgi:hypothetical protein
LEDAIDAANEDDFEVDVPMEKIDKEVAHCDIEDAPGSQSAVLYKVFGEI